MTFSKTVTFDLPKEELLERVVAEAARQLLTTYLTDPDGGKATLELNSPLAQRIHAAVVKTIERQAEALTPQIAQQVLEAGVQTTDDYGYATGPKKPLGAVIAERVGAELNGSRYGGRDKGLVATLIRDEVERQLKTELKATIDEAKRKVMKAVSDHAVKALEKAVVDALPEVRF